MDTNEVIVKINEVYELRDGGPINLTTNERDELYEILIDCYNMGYDDGFDDAEDNIRKSN